MFRFKKVRKIPEQEGGELEGKVDESGGTTELKDGIHMTIPVHYENLVFPII